MYLDIINEQWHCLDVTFRDHTFRENVFKFSLLMDNEMGQPYQPVYSVQNQPLSTI